ncbi:hypothetical protein DDB_G0291414 [Dictyostelium discoideum AX4]|uniref:COMM domain-containing protein n=1 Tax=Dictyostelium discoideum TaxID=44689 RepID=Q54EP6_DICDI|nr:hypothetical protein DDB_G0291414 [Dictyostelium discoideum AX4]EAL61691.1 hypothetical protein DDB_G0291414 [Dictyostelium discoideum AX4]|eukprot:XP_635194.1 hypothetical protein DDB_G0291414 [Dictyostelium discoideum AX4]
MSNSTNTCSLPRMVSLDWRMDIKTSSDVMSRMNVPSVLFKLEVEDKDNKVIDQDEEQKTKTVIFELNKETVNTMLDSLEFVKNQLDSIK